MKKLPILLLLALAACASNTREDRTAKTTADTLPATNTVATVPSKHLSGEDSLQAAFDSLLDSPGCSYAETKEGFKKDKLFFIRNYADTTKVYLLFNKKIEQLNIDTSMTNGKRHNDIFNNATYTVTLHIDKDTGAIDETWYEIGSLTIKSSDGKTISKNLYGLCGD
jgi:hypothetical protein